jgi:hypothetical protein
VSQVVEYLPSKCKGLSSNPSTREKNLKSSPSVLNLLFLQYIPFKESPIQLFRNFQNLLLSYSLPQILPILPNLIPSSLFTQTLIMSPLQRAMVVTVFLSLVLPYPVHLPSCSQSHLSNSHLRVTFHSIPYRKSLHFSAPSRVLFCSALLSNLSFLYATHIFGSGCNTLPVP